MIVNDVIMERYEKEIEKMIVSHYSHLGEKDRRHFAALEAEKLGHGGKIYIGGLLNISQKTLRKGEAELKNTDLYAQIPDGKQRRAGAGRKKFCKKC
jgi:hypothetical protein